MLKKSYTVKLFEEKTETLIRSRKIYQFCFGYYLENIFCCDLSSCASQNVIRFIQMNGMEYKCNNIYQRIPVKQLNLNSNTSKVNINYRKL